MDTETLNTILAIVAIGGGVGSIFAWGANLIVTRRAQTAQKKNATEQQEATRKLAEHASSLEHKVQLLSTHLNQRIERLDRIRDLINTIMYGSVALRQGSRAFEDKLHQSATRTTVATELRGLIFPMGDSQLVEAFRKLYAVLCDSIWAETWNRDDQGKSRFKPHHEKPLDNLLLDQSEHTAAMHQRILELKEEITSAEEKP